MVENLLKIKFSRVENYRGMEVTYTYVVLYDRENGIAVSIPHSDRKILFKGPSLFDRLEDIVLVKIHELEACISKGKQLNTPEYFAGVRSSPYVTKFEMVSLVGDEYELVRGWMKKLKETNDLGGKIIKNIEEACVKAKLMEEVPF